MAEKTINVTEKMISATVARGRSIAVPTADRRTVGFDKDTKQPIMGPIERSFKEHETVNLPEAEVKRLRKLGFLVDPAANAIPNAKLGQ